MSGGVRIKDLPDGDRPRERLAKLGPEALRDAELVAILLRTGLQGRSVVQVAEELVSKFGRLNQLAAASVDELCSVKRIGRDKAVTLKAAFTLAQRMARELHGESPLMDEPEKVAGLLREEMRDYEVEHFEILLLNTRRRLVRKELVSKGTLDATVVHPRDVFKSAIAANASAVILVHNHPSGDPQPSEADVRITRDLIRAGQLLKIDVLDHVIIGRRTEERERDYVSLRELGYFYE
ncbi:MAG: RadC family protein [Limisphaerales bacterium]